MQNGRGEPKAKPKLEVVVLVIEHARKAKNHFSLCCRARNTSYSFALPPWEILIFRFGGSRIFCQAFSLSTRKKRKYIQGIYEHFDEVMCEKANKNIFRY